MKKFILGNTYKYEEFAQRTWRPDHERCRALAPETRFVSVKESDRLGYFEQVVEPENPLVSSEQAQQAVEQLRERGMTYRQIARLSGVSIEAVHRSASGVGRIRRSTETALLQVASSLNGHG